MTGAAEDLDELCTAIRGERPLREQLGAITRADKDHGPEGLEAEIRQLLHQHEPLRATALDDG